MKTALLLAAASTLCFAAQPADAQTRKRARPAAAAAAPLPPAPYRLVGPASALEAETRSSPDEDGAGADTADAPPASPGAQRATPAAPATRAAPASPATGQAATPATRAAPATPAAPADQGAEQDDAADSADAGPATPERARSQEALTRVIGELRTGNVDYARMSEAVAARVRTQQPVLTPALTQYGAVQSIAPLGAAAADGAQRFRVTFANGAATWTINTDAQGRITNLGVE